MRIALINEFSQASKNGIVQEQLKKVVVPMGHEVFNTGMDEVNNPQNLPTDYTVENPRLTYIHIAIQSALLLNSKAVDFVVTGCGTGQGALMACNAFAGVVCGYCIEPTDAYLFLQINDGNALSIPSIDEYNAPLKSLIINTFNFGATNSCFPSNFKQ